VGKRNVELEISQIRNENRIALSFLQQSYHQTGYWQIKSIKHFDFMRLVQLHFVLYSFKCTSNLSGDLFTAQRQNYPLFIPIFVIAI